MPGRTGAILGLIYAVVWLAVADRQPGTASPASRLFHGATGVAIALPLLWEATTRFQFFPAAVGAATLGLVAAGALAVAWHRQLQSLAGIATIGVGVAALALAIATHATVPFAWLAIGLVAATWLLGEARGWRWLAWPAGCVELLLAVALVARALATPPLESATQTLALLAMLLVTATAPFVIRAFRADGGTRVFDAAQALLAVPIALFGLVGVATRLSDAGVAVIGAIMTAGGLGLYVLSFRRVRPRQGAGRNFYTASAVALAYVAVGVSQVLPHGPAAVLLALALLAMVWLSRRLGEAVLAAHAAILGAVALVGSGLVGLMAGVWIGTPQEWPAAEVPETIVLFALAAAAYLATAGPLGRPEWLAAASRVALDAMALLVIGAGLLRAVGPLVSGMPPSGHYATLKASVLAATAVLFSAARGRPWGQELGWLTLPVLAIGAIQLLAGDFTGAPAATLFVAFTIYGAAIVAASRFMRR